MAGTPVNLRGSVELARWAGVQKGRNLPDYVRQENGERIQECITFAATNHKFLEVEQGDYEMDLPGGLLIPAGRTGFTWIGHPSATFYQYANNTPILTVGVATVDSQKYNIRGMNLRYGNDQSANTGAVALKLGLLWQSRFSEVSVASTVHTPKAYIACEIMQSNTFFQNVMEKCAFFRASQSLFKYGALGTGNLFEDIYCSGVETDGTSGPVALPVHIEASGGNAIFGGTFVRFNIEWCEANKLMQLSNVRCAEFIDMHLEGNRLTGSNPTALWHVLAHAHYTSLKLYNNRMNSADGLTGTPSWFRSWNSCNVSVDSLLLEVDTASDINTDHFLFWQNTGELTTGTFQVRNLNFIGNAASDRLSIDLKLPKASFGSSPMEHIMEIHSYDPMSYVRGAWILPLASQDFTVYGAHVNPRIEYNQVMTANRTVTLSNVVGPAATQGAGTAIPAGRQILVRRGGGATGAFDLLVRNHDATLLSTISATSTQIRYDYNGTNWVVGA